ncbi:MAG: polysaccharide export protein [Verrucomicrobia bacterium]|nr:polysaccharide export protein [Verrucomicrobiota bacterium]
MKRLRPLLMLQVCSLVPLPGQAAAPEGPAKNPAAHAVPGNQGPTAPESWRKRFELGPGDVINFALFGRPELDRPGFRIAPDGTVSYLQAQNIKVSGLTIDEARLAIEKGLAPHFRSPRVIITPQEVASKRFTILGKVVNRGVVTLERPITLVEAIANAGGLETGLFEANTIELADLERSFVSRNGRRLAVDFRRLLHEGDMSFNIEIEPNDYIYIASNISNDYYVLGAVASPGVQGLTPDASVVAAITRRSGFTERAWTDRVLVIRGSFTAPQTHVVNVKKVLAAKEKDFKLEPKDIVYIADRPWTVAEDILQVALAAFVTSATSSWVNLQVNP